MAKLLVAILMLACVATVYGQGPKVIISVCDMAGNHRVEDGCKANCKNYSTNAQGCVYIPETDESMFLACKSFPKCAQGRFYMGSDCQASILLQGEFHAPCACFKNGTVDCQPTQAVVKQCSDATCHSSCSLLVTAPLNKCANYVDHGQDMSVNVRNYAPCDQISYRTFSGRTCRENPSGLGTVPANICAWALKHNTKSYSARLRCEK